MVGGRHQAPLDFPLGPRDLNSYLQDRHIELSSNIVPDFSEHRKVRLKDGRMRRADGWRDGLVLQMTDSIYAFTHTSHLMVNYSVVCTDP